MRLPDETMNNAERNNPSNVVITMGKDQQNTSSGVQVIFDLLKDDIPDPQKKEKQSYDTLVYESTSLQGGTVYKDVVFLKNPINSMHWKLGSKNSMSTNGFYKGIVKTC